MCAPVCVFVHLPDDKTFIYLLFLHLTESHQLLHSPMAVSGHQNKLGVALTQTPSEQNLMKCAFKYSQSTRK